MTTSTRKGIALLGSTGSIGQSALDVIAQFPEHFDVVGLAAGRNLDRLAADIDRFRPAIVSIERAEDIAKLRDRVAGDPPEILCGIEGAEAVAAHGDAELVLTAMVGAVGLRPTLAAIRRGVEVAITNKEPLVAAGQLCTEEAARCGAVLLPVDSEHSAIFQCLAGCRRQDVRRLLLCCSGGPFRQRGLEDLASVTVEDALQHPTWSMGRKITIDSATLMNKALEIIEARWLFDVPQERVDVVIHPQSIVHSMVELVDGAVLAQLGTPDMRVPIGVALGYPARLPLSAPRLDWTTQSQLTFEPPDPQRFPALALAREALRVGGTAPAVINAANEVAVEAFLDRRVGYVQICETVERVLEAHRPLAGLTLDEIIEADSWARETARGVIAHT